MTSGQETSHILPRTVAKSPESGTQAERRQEILETTHQAVKRCQVRYGSMQELATEGSDEVQGLLTTLELVLSHGMREPGDSGSIWRMVRTILNKEEYQRYLLLSSLATDRGRGRAWLRSVLNEQSLERHLQMLLGDDIRLIEFYETWSFMRDQERANMLPAMAADLTSIWFALKVDAVEEEKSYFDAEAIYGLNLTVGKVLTLRAKIINGLSIAGKTVQVDQHPSVGSEVWVVKERKKVNSDGSIYLRVLAKEVNPSGGQVGKISKRSLLAQISF